MENGNQNSKLAKPSSESSELAKSSGISPESFSLISTWVTAVCNNKRMEVPDKGTFKLTWIQPLSIYHPKVVDEAFRDYLQTGAGEFFDTHAITGRCNAILASREGDAKRARAGCAFCNWTGWVASESQPNAVRRCGCFFDANLRSEKPEVPRMDLGDVREQVMGRALASTEFPKIPND